VSVASGRSVELFVGVTYVASGRVAISPLRFADVIVVGPLAPGWPLYVLTLPMSQNRACRDGERVTHYHQLLERSNSPLQTDSYNLH